MYMRVCLSIARYGQELMSGAKERSTAHVGLLRHRLK